MVVPTSATPQGAFRPSATVNNAVGFMVIPPAHLPVDLWTRLTDRPEPCGTCGQPMDRAAHRPSGRRAQSRRGPPVAHPRGPLAHQAHRHNNRLDKVCSQMPLRWGRRCRGKPGYPHQT